MTMIERVAAEPIILVRFDDPDKKPQLYACGKCGRVNSPLIYACLDERAHEVARDAAANCYECKPNPACECGAECPKGRTRCDGCRINDKLAKAVEISDDGGPYFAFGGDSYYHELDAAAGDGVEWVAPCTVSYPSIDADSVLENLLDDMHEDASVDDIDATDAFIEAVKSFNAAQTTQSFWADETRKIRVPAQAAALTPEQSK